MRTIDFRYAPYRSWTCIGRPDDPHKTLVTEAGSLLYGFRKDPSRIEIYRFARVVDFRVQGARTVRATRQWTESARVPITVTELVFEDQTLRLETVGHADDEGRRSDVLLWQIRVHDDAPELLLTGLWIQIQDEGWQHRTPGRGHSPFVITLRTDELPPAEGLTAMFDYHPIDIDPPVGRTVSLVSSRPLQEASAFDFGPASGLRQEPALVPPGGTLTGAIVLPLDADPQRAPSEADVEAMIASERRYWSALPALDLPMSVADDDLQAMLVASARNILQARERKEGRIEFQVGPTIYRGLWVVDSYFFLEAGRYLGLDTDVDEGTEALMARARPDGAIEEMDFHYKETAIAIATLTRQADLVGDETVLERHWPAVMCAVDYIERLIEESLALPEDRPNHGLLPASMADGGAGGMRPEYTTALWTWIGLDAVRTAAARLGRSEDARRCAALADALYERLLAGRARDLAHTDEQTPYWPMVMPGSGDHHWIADAPEVPGRWRRLNPGSATWALAQAIHPGEAFAPDDPVVRDFCALMDEIDDDEGIPAETGWLPHRALWNYAASFSAQVWLYTDRPDKAVDYLYAFVNHASPTRVWREEQSFRATRNGQDFGDMPHNWASVELIRWVRHLLAFEVGDELRLLAGTPETWLRDGGVRLDSSPTRFGRLTLRAKIGAEGLEIEAQLAVTRPPESITVRLPVASELPLWVNGVRFDTSTSTEARIDVTEALA